MSSDPHDDLVFLRHLMEQTRRFTLISGNYLVAWGLLISVGFACDGIAAIYRRELPLGVIWIGLIAAGWTYSLWYSKRKAAREPVAGHAARVINQLWMACGVAMTTAFLVGEWSGALAGAASGGLSALFIGIGVFMTGVLNGMDWLRNLSLGWWAGAVALFVWHGPASLWIGVALFIGLLVIPGLILNSLARSMRQPVQ